MDKILEISPTIWRTMYSAHNNILETRKLNISSWETLGSSQGTAHAQINIYHTICAHMKCDRDVEQVHILILRLHNK